MMWQKVTTGCLKVPPSQFSGAAEKKYEGQIVRYPGSDSNLYCLRQVARPLGCTKKPPSLSK